MNVRKRCFERGILNNNRFNNRSRAYFSKPNKESWYDLAVLTTAVVVVGLSIKELFGYHLGWIGLEVVLIISGFITVLVKRFRSKHT